MKNYSEEIDARIRFKRVYFYVYFFRRIIFVVIGFFLNKSHLVAQQIVCVLFLNLFTMMYIGHAQALIKREINLMDMMNEIFMAFVTFLTIAFTDFV